MVVEAKPKNAAFVPFRMVNYLAETPEQLVAAVSEVLDTVAEEEKYRPGIQEITSGEGGGRRGWVGQRGEWVG